MDNNADTNSKSSATSNVGTKVRYWVSDFVSEMRRKSPAAAVQKWVDSLPIHSETASTSTTLPATYTNIIDLHIPKNEENTECEVLQHQESTLLQREKSNLKEAESKKKPFLWHTPNFKMQSKCENLISSSPKDERDSENNINNDGECSMKRDKTNSETDDASFTNNFKILSKTKLNEFYDKLNLNKKRYNFIKSKRIDVKNVIGQINSDLQDMKLNLEANEREETNKTFDKQCISKEEGSKDFTPSPSLSDCVKISNYDDEEFSFDDTFPKDDITSSPEINELSQNSDNKHINIGGMGRSKSVNPTCIKIPRINDIGRSFSDSKTDDDHDNSFIINERNNSCPNPLLSLSTNVICNSYNKNLSPSDINIPRNHTLENIMVYDRRDSPFSKRYHRAHLLRDSSLQSDLSPCSSVESLLESRKPDPETILINLGFGPVETEDVLSKIPKRFLKPSQVKGINTEEFIRQQQLASHVHENSVLGYRGLVGNPHISPSSIVAKIQERFQENENARFLADDKNRPSSAPPTPGPAI